MLLVQLLALMMAENRLEYMSLYNPAIVDVNIKNQPRITVDGKKYRADFMVSVEYKGKTGAYYVHYLIECDGYEFHQKTKKQVEYDNARTRDLQKCGYIVVRFSGSEIWNHPHNCIMELVSIILSNCNK